MRMPGVKMAAADVTLTAKAPRSLAVALREAARANCRNGGLAFCEAEVPRFSKDDFVWDKSELLGRALSK